VVITQVLAEKVSDGVPGVKIKQFSGNTADTVEKIVRANTDPSKPNKILLDLRDDPGGLLPGGIAAASLFLPANSPVVSQVDRTNVPRAERTIFDGPFADGDVYRVALLVNGQTASAAEVSFRRRKRGTPRRKRGRCGGSGEPPADAGSCGRWS
jgi:carboxyl-terminal processing protease